jgi:hypothetical protein
MIPYPQCDDNEVKKRSGIKLRVREMRRPLAFKGRDVTRATKAVLAAGLPIEKIEISKDGVITVVPRRGADIIESNEPDVGYLAPSNRKKIVL